MPAPLQESEADDSHTITFKNHVPGNPCTGVGVRSSPSHCKEQKQTIPKPSRLLNSPQFDSDPVQTKSFGRLPPGS